MQQMYSLDRWVGKILWSKKWQSTLGFLPGKSHKQRSLVGYSPWGHERVGHNWLTKQQASTIIVSQSNFTTPKKFFIPLHPNFSLLPSQLLADTDLFAVLIVLPFPECHVVGIIQYIAFSYWQFSLTNMHLMLFHLFLAWWLISF